MSNYNGKPILGLRLQTRIDQLRSIARRAGFEVSVSRIGEAGTQRRVRGVSVTKESARRKLVEAKYRNPDNSSETWSGRGREPRWLSEKIAAGRRREEFAIKSG